MQMLQHPDIVALTHSFFSTTHKQQLYLNLVLEYVPQTLNHIATNYTRINHHMPLIYVKLYSYQICRALAYFVIALVYVIVIKNHKNLTLTITQQYHHPSKTVKIFQSESTLFQFQSQKDILETVTTSSS
ncbi:unnamed protein product [Lupinus luteus]|uniref:Protein kinase domain-containing protein n=1 Tax=Lupinus luteus TaxID=3873 RepID=A0AAV1Y3U7_LUPLU